MPFSYYQPGNTPAPDWGSLVHAKLGRQQSRQAALNALTQMAEENQRIKAHREDEANANRMHQFQLDEQVRHDTATEAGQQAAREEDMRAREDLNARADSAQEAATARTMASQIGSYLRTVRTEQERNNRAELEARTRIQVEQEKRAQAIQKLEEARRRSKAMVGAMDALSNAPNGFESHEFTAAQLAPFYSADPARMIASIRGSKFAAGKDETAEDIYNNLLKEKVAIHVAPEGWFAKTIKPFAEDLTPQDIESLAKYAHGPDLVPYAASPGEARSRAFDFFKGHTSLGRVFAGSESAQTAPPKPGALAPGEKFNREHAMTVIKENQKWISLIPENAEDPDMKSLRERAVRENEALLKRFGAGDEAGASGADAALKKELDDLLNEPK